MKTCKKIEKWHFLWWSGENTYYDHEWTYYGMEHRMCVNCGRQERFFGMTGEFDRIEDWRKTHFERNSFLNK